MPATGTQKIYIHIIQVDRYTYHTILHVCVYYINIYTDCIYNIREGHYGCLVSRPFGGNLTTPTVGDICKCI